MKTATEVLAAIEEIAATSSKNDKEALLDTNLDDPLFAKVLTAALDPFVTYGIKKLPAIRDHLDLDLTLDGSAFDILDDLAHRVLTGNAAADSVKAMLEAHAEPSAELLRRILLKDLRAGFTRNSVNRVRPGLIATFDCMLSHKYEEKRFKKGEAFYIEPKLDGVRVLAFVDVAKVSFYSRSGKPFHTFDHLKPHFQRMASGLPGPVVFDGEVVSGSFNKTVGDVRRKDEQAEDAVFWAFDVIGGKLFKGEKGNETNKGYSDRREILKRMIARGETGDVRLVPSYLVKSHEEIMEKYQKFRDMGLEGAIVKPADGKYQRKRSWNWMKIKGEETADLRVIGAFEGNGKYVGMLGGLIVDCEGVEVSVGGGFTDAQREEFWEAFDLESEPECSAPLITGRLIEVEYHEKTPDGSLRHPRFVRFRDDKDMEKAA